MWDDMEAKLTTVGVAGLGFMGRGIVSCLLSFGVRVIAYTPAPGEFIVARASIASDLTELIERAGFGPFADGTSGPSNTRKQPRSPTLLAL